MGIVQIELWLHLSTTGKKSSGVGRETDKLKIASTPAACDALLWKVTRVLSTNIVDSQYCFERLEVS